MFLRWPLRPIGPLVNTWLLWTEERKKNGFTITTPKNIVFFVRNLLTILFYHWEAEMFQIADFNIEDSASNSMSVRDSRAEAILFGFDFQVLKRKSESGTYRGRIVSHQNWTVNRTEPKIPRYTVQRYIVAPLMYTFI